jgi:hypothetical protein
VSIAQLLLRCGDRFRVEPRPPLSLAGNGPREAAYVLDEHVLESGAGRLYFSEYTGAGPDALESAAAAALDRNDTVDGVWGAAGVVGVMTESAGTSSAGPEDIAGVGDSAAGEACEVAFGDERYAPRVDEGLALLSQVRRTLWRLCLGLAWTAG